MQSFGGPFHSNSNSNLSCNTRKCVRRSCSLFIEMKSTLARFPTYVNPSNLSEIVKINNIRISNKNDVDRGSDCEVRRAGKT